MGVDGSVFVDESFGGFSGFVEGLDAFLVLLMAAVALILMFPTLEGRFGVGERHNELDDEAVDGLPRERLLVFSPPFRFFVRLVCSDRRRTISDVTDLDFTAMLASDGLNLICSGDIGSGWCAPFFIIQYNDTDECVATFVIDPKARVGTIYIKSRAILADLARY